MPFSLRFAGPLVLVRYTGEVTAADLRAVVDAIAAHPDFDAQRYHLVDFGTAQLPPLDETVLLAMAPVIGATITNRSITTVYVPDSAATRAFVDHCGSLFRKLRVHYAPDVETAMEWVQAQTMTVLTLRE